jgi:hypothetical protein
MKKYRVGDLIIAQKDDGEKFVAMIASRGFESSRHVMDRPVRIENIVAYRTLTGEGVILISDSQIIKKIKTGESNV